MCRGHPCDRTCRKYGIEHRLTRPNHPWRNGQVERMNRTLKDATVNRYFYQYYTHLLGHLQSFCEHSHNFVKRLKTLRKLAPY